MYYANSSANAIDALPVSAQVTSPALSDCLFNQQILRKYRPALATQLNFRAMKKHELDQALRWTAQEGWNPGVNDASIFWETKREGLFVAELGGEIVATGSVVRYEPNYYYLGLLMVRPDQRGKGIGRRTFAHWRHVMTRLAAGKCLEVPVIEMDAEPAMQRFYSANGFHAAHEQVRYSCTVGGWVQFPTMSHNALRDLSELPFELVEQFDRDHFGALRTTFLEKWISPSSGTARAVLASDGKIRALGVIRRAVSGWRVGPLFATDPQAANLLFHDLCYKAKVRPGEEVFIDVPKINPHAVELASLYQMQIESTAVRMHFGDARLSLPWQQIYGITTLDLG